MIIIGLAEKEIEKMKITRRQLRRIIKEELQVLLEVHPGHGDADSDGIKDFADADPYGGGVVDLDDPGMGVHSFEEETSADPFWDPDVEPGMIGRPRESDPMPRRHGEISHGYESRWEPKKHAEWEAERASISPPGSTYRIPGHLRKSGKKLRRR